MTLRKVKSFVYTMFLWDNILMTYERYVETGELQNQVIAESMIFAGDTLRTFEFLGAQQWIDEFTVRKESGAVDIEATALKAGVMLVIGMPIVDGKKVYSHGITLFNKDSDKNLESITVHVNDDDASNHTITFGHELGHVFLETAVGLGAEYHGDGIEDFCEQFGRQIAVPVEMLADISVVDADTIAQLMDRFEAEHSTVIHQLMLAGKLPRQFIIDTSMPETPNPLYSQKIRRHVFCSDCATGTQHETTPEIGSSFVLDATKYEWSYKTERIECGSVNQDIGDAEGFKTLNTTYGRWSMADDLLLHLQNTRKTRQNRALTRLVMRDSDIY